MGDMDGKVAVITGAGQGMGRACAELFAAEGSKVVVADVSGRQEETAITLGDVALPIRCDVTSEDDVRALFVAAIEHFGHVDAVLNVAGIGVGGPLHEMDMGAYDKLMAVDLRGVYLGTKHGVRALLERDGGGAIVNWSSLAALATGSYASAYAAAKAGVAALTRSAATEYGHRNIRVNAICPGVILTEMGEAALVHDPEKPARNPMGRAGRPEEVAQLALFLASDRSSYISGLSIPIDGGWSAKLA
jgi:NAD(P)-dependent dehydrogenase (short-subunit alcohol dehydrogenase family)